MGIKKLVPKEYISGNWYSSSGIYTYGSSDSVTIKRRTITGDIQTRGNIQQINANLVIYSIISTSINDLIFIHAKNITTGNRFLLKSTDGGLTFSSVLSIGYGIYNVGILGDRGFCELTKDSPGIGGIKKGTMLVGEYNTNTQRSPGSTNDTVRLIKSEDNGSTWEIINTWNADGSTNNITHIHAVKQDPYTGYIYICTGESGGCSGIIRWDGAGGWLPNVNISSLSGVDGFKVVYGAEKHCTVDMLFTADNIFTFTDSHSFSETESGIWKRSKDLSTFVRVDNQSFLYSQRQQGWWGEKIGDVLVYSTSLEGASTTTSLFYLSNDGGETWYAVSRAKMSTNSLVINGVFQSNGLFFVSSSSWYDAPQSRAIGSAIMPHVADQKKIVLTDTYGKKAIGWLVGRSGGISYGSNLLSDGTFEGAIPPSSFTAQNGATLSSSTDVHSGSSGVRSMVCLRGTSDAVALSSTIYATVGKLYEVKFWGKSVSNGHFGVELRTYGASTSFVMSSTYNSLTDTSWKEYSDFGTIPLGTTSTALYLSSGWGTGSSSGYDDISIRTINAPPETGSLVFTHIDGMKNGWASIDSGFAFNNIASWIIVDTSGNTIADSSGSTFNRADFSDTAFIWSSVDISQHINTDMVVYNLPEYTFNPTTPLALADATHPGPVKKSITATGQVGVTFEDGATYQLSDDHLSREATGFTYGTENAFYNADGTPKSVTKDTFEVNATGLRLYFGSKGITGYSVDQTAKDAKILKFIRSSGTILDPDTILDPETYLV